MNQNKYSRQILFSPIGEEGQKKLLSSKAVIIGCGALGTAQANALVRAGVGALRIVDRDYVEESNLQRQSLFDENDARDSLPKAIAVERKLKEINSEVLTEGVVADATSHNIEDLVRGFDVILDGTDNFEARYLLNDVAVKLGIPWIYGAIVASSAVTMTILPGRGPCLSCVFPQAPAGLHETCDTVGVIGPAAAWTSAIQVTEALKILLGREQELHGTLFGFDIWRNRTQQVRPKRDSDCRTCVQRVFTYLEEGETLPTTLCGRDAVQIRHRDSRRLDMGLLKARLEQFGTVRANDFLLKFSFDGYELTVFTDGRAIIKGTHDPAVARSIYAKYISA
ncbi:MAG: thiazole biosynthesis adenylyltransferase ThiF [Acidobacteria bacterium]|nr:MAG: thiazole biosynthesis adenylyltransferase ThiF [Acidobacteriota bacterium]